MECAISADAQSMCNAFKIPPTYKCPTASNITFEPLGQFNLYFKSEVEYKKSESCNPTIKVSPPLPGEKSRPPTPESILVDTIPLWNSTMEKELMEELWITPKLNNSNITEESTINSIWEEDYQDLSYWCIDTFHNRCIVPTDESKMMIYSGMKTGNISLSTGIVENGIDDREIDCKSNIITMQQILQNTNNQSEILSVDNKKVNMQENLHTADVMLDSIQSSDHVKTDKCVELIDNLNKNESHQHVTKIDNSILNVVDIQPESWDVINAGPSDTFDLLSYLCDDNIQATENISVNASPDIQQKKAIIHNTTTTTSTSSASASTSTSSKGATSFRNKRAAKIENNESQVIPCLTRNGTKNKKRDSHLISSPNKYSQVATMKRNKEDTSIPLQIKKQKIDIDSDDQSSICSIEESRYKNNEASRKSRMNKKTREKEMLQEADELEKKNILLKMKVEQLDNMVTSMRAAILQSALKKSS